MSSSEPSARPSRLETSLEPGAAPKFFTNDFVPCSVGGRPQEGVIFSNQAQDFDHMHAKIVEIQLQRLGKFFAPREIGLPHDQDRDVREIRECVGDEPPFSDRWLHLLPSRLCDQPAQVLWWERGR